MNGTLAELDAEGRDAPRRPGGAWDFGRLFAECWPMALSVARVLGKNHQDAEDAVQTAFAILLEKKPALHIAEAERAYLLTTIRRNLLRQARDSHLPLDLLSAGSFRQLWVHGADEQDVAESEAWAAGLLRELPPRQRQVLTLAAEGCKSAEIAALLGIEPNAVRVHLHHARARLKARLAADLALRAA